MVDSWAMGYKEYITNECPLKQGSAHRISTYVTTTAMGALRVRQHADHAVGDSRAKSPAMTWVPRSNDTEVLTEGIGEWGLMGGNNSRAPEARRDGRRGSAE